MSFDDLRLPSGTVDLMAIPTDATPGFDEGKKAGEKALAAMGPELAELQERLFAARSAGSTRNVLLVPVYLAYVSTEEYGAWLATGGTLVQLLISDYGVSGVILQRVAASYGANDRVRLAGVLGAADWPTFRGVNSAGIAPDKGLIEDFGPDKETRAVLAVGARG